MKSFIIIAIAALLLSSCGGGEETNTCVSAPTAIFAEIDSFQNHTFEVNGQNSKESVLIPALALDLELYQSGCKSLTQEYRFILHGTIPQNLPPQNCAIEIASIFYSMSQMDAKLFEYQQWAEALKMHATQFKYNEKVPLQGSGISAQIIKQHQPKSTILTVIFEG